MNAERKRFDTIDNKNDFRTSFQIQNAPKEYDCNVKQL